ncbi:MAG: hypothetical protein RL189_2856 [Pseudomonadota bacterium]|jgi:ABC-type transport system involved in cytochrome bd biosynthesis fused ATPase/permease subunit
MRTKTNIIITLMSAICMTACGQDYNLNRDYSLEEDEAIFSTEEIDRQLTQEKPVAEDSQNLETADNNSVTIVSTEDVVIANEPIAKPAAQLSSAGKATGDGPKKVIKIKTKWNAR